MSEFFPEIPIRSRMVEPVSGRMTREWQLYFADLKDFFRLVRRPAQTATNGDFFEITLRRDGATTGPVIVVDRDSPTPAPNDNIGAYQFQARNTIKAKSDYAQLKCVIVSPIAGSEWGRFDIETEIDGATGRRISVLEGVFSPTSTGGDRGFETLNFKEIYEDGVRVATTTPVAMPVLDGLNSFSDPPTTQEVESVLLKLNELLQKLRDAGLMET